MKSTVETDKGKKDVRSSGEIKEMREEGAHGANVHVCE